MRKLLLVLLLLACSQALAAIHPWQYRRMVTITNSTATDITGGVFKIRLTAATFSFDSCKVDGSDLRVTDSTGSALLPMFLESWDNAADTANVWTKVAHTVGAGASYTVALYFGNPYAPSVSNASNVFTFYDDFAATRTVIAAATPATFTRVTEDTIAYSIGGVGELDSVALREIGNVVYDATRGDRAYIHLYSGYRSLPYDTDSSRLFQEVSADGLTWTREGAIEATRKGEDPFIIKKGDSLFCYFEEKTSPVAVNYDQIGMYWSADWGVTWTFYGVVWDTIAATWNNRSPSSPTGYFDEPAPKLYLFFEAKGSCTECGVGQIGLIASTDMRNFTLVGDTVIIGLGANGTFDDSGMVPDWLEKVGSTFYLGYHGLGAGSSSWKMGILSGTNIEALTRDARGGQASLTLSNEDPQFFQTTDGVWRTLVAATNGLTVHGGRIATRDTTVWAGSGWQVMQKAGYYGSGNTSGGSLTLSGEHYVRSSTTLRSTATVTQDFIFEMNGRFANYGTGTDPRFAMSIGSDSLCDLAGTKSSWETTYPEAGYGFTIHSTNSRLYRIPADAARVGLGTAYAQGTLTSNHTYGLSYESSDDSLKSWVDGALTSGAVDATFDAVAKYYMFSQGMLASSWSGGDAIINWTRIRPLYLPVPTVSIGSVQVKP